jgi:hypothetical protein
VRIRLRRIGQGFAEVEEVGLAQVDDGVFGDHLAINNTLFELLGGYCGKDAEIVKNDASRDLWLDSSEALEYGIIDEIVVSKKKGS